MIRTIIADDHPVVREGLKSIIESEEDMQVVTEVSNHPDIFKALGNDPVDVLVMDLSMEGGSFLNAITHLNALYPDMRILVVSVQNESIYALRCYRAGASGYLNKDSAAEELVDAIRLINEQGKYISPAITGILLHDEINNKTPHESLTNREFEIFTMLVSGMRINEIAGQLSLSPKTVSTHRAKLLSKMKLKSNVDLFHYAVRHNLIEGVGK